MGHPSIVVIVDQSDSMWSLGYLGPAKTDAATFVNVMQVGDQIGVVAFSDSATVIFPSGGSSVTPVTSDAVLFQAAQAIMQLQPINMTNMVAALTTSHGLVASAAAPRAIVFLSDGMWNVGGDPLPGLASDIPVHTIALGPNGEQAVLNAIATRTGGAYHYTPDAVQLQLMYDAIAAQSQIAALVTDAIPTVQQNHFIRTPAAIPGGAGEATFAVNWTDWTVSYTPNTPVGRQLNVFLYDPNGQRVNVAANSSGPGYVVFKVPSPMAGIYTAYAWYAGDPGLQSLVYTAAVFDDNTALSASLELASQTLEAGQPVEFAARVTDQGDPVIGAAAHASLESPLISRAEAIEAYRPVLKSFAPSEDPVADDPDAGRFAAFIGQLADPATVLPRSRVPVAVAEVRPGVYTASIPGDHKPGAHTVRIRIDGQAPASGTPFTRTVQGSVFVR